MTSLISHKKEKGFTLTSLMVTCSIVGIMLPFLHQISMVPVITQAKAANFQLAESSATLFVARSLKNQQVGPTPNNCSVTTDDSDALVYTISCTEGHLKAVQSTVARTFNLDTNRTVSGLGVYSDNDLDGFDDVTGLFTHYAECYSGWKGQGSLKNNCKLGGEYVIPAYAHLY